MDVPLIVAPLIRRISEDSPKVPKGCPFLALWPPQRPSNRGKERHKSKTYFAQF